MKPLTPRNLPRNRNYHLLATEAMNLAIARIQEELGEDEGGWAGIYFDGTLKPAIDQLAEYAEWQDKMTNLGAPDYAPEWPNLKV